MTGGVLVGAAVPATPEEDARAAAWAATTAEATAAGWRARWRELERSDHD